MKKLLSVIICACLALSMFTFVACDVTDTEKEETSSSATTNEQTSAEAESNTDGETTTGTDESSSDETSSVTEGNGTGNNEETTTATQQGGNNNQEGTTTAQQGGSNNQEGTTAAQQGGNSNQEVTTAASQGGNNNQEVTTSTQQGNTNTENNNPTQNLSNAYSVYMNAVQALNNASNYTATVLQTVNYTMAGGATQTDTANVKVFIDGNNEISDVTESYGHHISHYVDGIYYTISLSSENPQGKMYAIDQETYASSYSDKQSILLPAYPEKCFTADKVSIRKEIGGKYTLTLDISHEDYIEYMVGQGMPSANTPTFEKVQLIVTIGADGKVESFQTYMAYNYQGVYAVVDMTIAFSNYGSTVVEAPENLDLYVDPSTPPTENGDEKDEGGQNKDPNNNNTNVDNEAFNIFMTAANQLHSATNYSVFMSYMGNYSENGGEIESYGHEVRISVDGNNEISDYLIDSIRQIYTYVDGVLYEELIMGNETICQKSNIDKETYDFMYSAKNAYMLPFYPQSWFTADNTTVFNENGNTVLSMTIPADEYVEYMIGIEGTPEDVPTFTRVELFVKIGEDGNLGSIGTYTAYEFDGICGSAQTDACFSFFGETVVEAPENADEYVDVNGNIDSDISSENKNY